MPQIQPGTEVSRQPEQPPRRQGHEASLMPGEEETTAGATGTTGRIVGREHPEGEAEGPGTSQLQLIHNLRIHLSLSSQTAVVLQPWIPIGIT